MDETEALRQRVAELEERLKALEATVQAEKERAKRNLLETVRIVSEVAAAVGIKIETELNDPEQGQ
jgi:hypothetical protein